MSKITKLFGNAIRRQREAKGLLQKDLAGLLGVDTAYASALESGRKGVSSESVEKVAEVLGCEPWELLVDYEKPGYPQATIAGLKHHYEEMKEDHQKFLSEAATALGHLDKLSADNEALKTALAAMADKIKNLESRTGDSQLDDLIVRLRNIDKTKRHHVELGLQAAERKPKESVLQADDGLKPKKA